MEKNPASKLLEKAFTKAEIESSPNTPIVYGRTELTKNVSWISKVSEEKDLAFMNYRESTRLPSAFKKAMSELGCLYWGGMYFSHSGFLDNFEGCFKKLFPKDLFIQVIRRKDGYEYLVVSPRLADKNISSIYHKPFPNRVVRVVLTISGIGIKD